MKFIELFAGIGGFRYGLEQCVDFKCADKKPRQTKSQIQFGRVGTFMEKGRGILSPNEWGGRSIYRCVWANEINESACQIYRKNFGEKELYEGDITNVDTRDIPDHDLLVGGFPCQTFSIAGKRAGFDDTRGTLFFEIARILRDKRPRCVLLENVKGLLSHDGGKTFQTILKVLSDIGYRVEWQVLNSKDFGVPQKRERVFIVGHLRGESRRQVFPIQGKYRAPSQSSYQMFDRPVEYIRTFTPIECERLQGFPDGWTEGVSDTQRYKMLGNAVTVKVVKVLGNKINEKITKGD